MHGYQVERGGRYCIIDKTMMFEVTFKYYD